MSLVVLLGYEGGVFGGNFCSVDCLLLGVLSGLLVSQNRELKLAGVPLFISVPCFGQFSGVFDHIPDGVVKPTSALGVTRETTIITLSMAEGVDPVDELVAQSRVKGFCHDALFDVVGATFKTAVHHLVNDLSLTFARAKT